MTEWANPLTNTNDAKYHTGLDPLLDKARWSSYIRQGPENRSASELFMESSGQFRVNGARAIAIQIV